jgi:heme exporter protein A
MITPGSARRSSRRFGNLCEAEPTPLPTANGVDRLGVKFDRVEKRYGSLFALRRVSLEIQPGEFVALIGPNGAGKTTLLRTAALLVRPNSGTVQYPGLIGDSRISIKSRIGMVAHSTLLYDELTAAENLRLFADLYGVANPDARVAELLEACGLADRAASLVRTFSRGMRQRLAIARALVQAPRLLLLDEPSSGLDLQGREWFAEVLAALQADECTVIVSTHSRDEILQLATRAVRIAAGQIEADSGRDGNPGAILAALRSEN